MKINDQKLVIGTLSSENCAQISYDLVFEKEFELSHGGKNVSVYFCGYKSDTHEDDEDISGEFLALLLSFFSFVPFTLCCSAC